LNKSKPFIFDTWISTGFETETEIETTNFEPSRNSTTPSTTSQMKKRRRK
jgi:hypothetical protein